MDKKDEEEDEIEASTKLKEVKMENIDANAHGKFVREAL
jgi:hypothetical protein